MTFRLSATAKRLFRSVAIFGMQFLLMSTLLSAQNSPVIKTPSFRAVISSELLSQLITHHAHKSIELQNMHVQGWNLSGVAKPNFRFDVEEIKTNPLTLNFQISGDAALRNVSLEKRFMRILLSANLNVTGQMGVGLSNRIPEIKSIGLSVSPTSIFARNRRPNGINLSSVVKRRFNSSLVEDKMIREIFKRSKNEIRQFERTSKSLMGDFGDSLVWKSESIEGHKQLALCSIENSPQEHAGCNTPADGKKKLDGARLCLRMHQDKLTKLLESMIDAAAKPSAQSPSIQSNQFTGLLRTLENHKVKVVLEKMTDADDDAVLFIKIEFYRQAPAPAEPRGGHLNLVLKKDDRWKVREINFSAQNVESAKYYLDQITSQKPDWSTPIDIANQLTQLLKSNPTFDIFNQTTVHSIDIEKDGWLELELEFGFKAL